MKNISTIKFILHFALNIGIFVMLGAGILTLNGCKKEEITMAGNNPPQNGDNMIETFDFTEYEKRINNDPANGWFYTKPDGTLVEEINSANPVRWEMPPKPSFVKVYKEFYPNGNIKRKETYFGKYTKVDTSLYYGKKGNLKKKIDENKKFGKIKPEDVLSFLEEKKHINLKTGEGAFDSMGEAEFEIVYNKKKNVWHITMRKGRLLTYEEMLERIREMGRDGGPVGEPNEWTSVVYIIDGETGKE
ncbi:MAG: hypothetical protein LBL61_00285 [Elusimicrobiota bacterium]|jgi:hypothetical protein|nr:hypothetical protein [Elusimicrobiota bacterium]